MIKELLLMGALTFAPIQTLSQAVVPLEEVIETPIEDTTETFESKTYTYVNEEETEKIEVILIDSETCSVVINNEETKDGVYLIDGTTLYVEVLGYSYNFTINLDNSLTLNNGFNWEEWLEQWFTPEQVATIMSWVSYIATIIVLVWKLVKTIKEKGMTAEEVRDAVIKDLKVNVDTLNENIKNEIKETTDSTLKDISKSLYNQDEILTKFIEILALEQQNTPEARIAVLKLIKELGKVSNETVDNAITSVENEQEEEKAKVENAKESVEDVINKTNDGMNGTSI